MAGGHDDCRQKCEKTRVRKREGGKKGRTEDVREGRVGWRYRERISKEVRKE